MTEDEGTKATATALAAMADEWFALRNMRLEIQRKADELKAGEDKIHATVLELMQQLGLTSIGGQKCILTMKTTYEPTIESWPIFYDYIKETGEFDLLYRRINPAAVKARWDNNATVPGVQKFPVQKLSFSGVK